MPKRIKDLLTQARFAAADDFAALDGATGNTRKISPFDEHAQFGNSRGPRGGVSSDGLAGTRLSRDGGAALAFAAGEPVCYAILASIPSANPAANLGLFGQSDTLGSNVRAGALDAYLDTARNFIGRLYGATTADYRQISFSLAPWAGELADLHWDVRAGTSGLAVNGIFVPSSSVTETTAGTPPAWSAAVTGTVYNVGARQSSEPFIGVLANFRLWNMQPDAATVAEIFKRGIPPRCRWATQVDSLPSGSALKSGAADGTTLPTTGSVTASGGGTLSAQNGARDGGAGAKVLRLVSTGYECGNHMLGIFGSAAPGAALRVSLWARLVSGTRFRFGNTANDVGGVAVTSAAWTQFSATLTVEGDIGRPSLRFYFYQGSAGDTAEIDDLVVIPLGVVVHLPLAGHAGLVKLDASANKLDALATNLADMAPERVAVIRASTSTNGNQQLFGAGVIDTTRRWRVRSWSVNCATGTPTVSLGNVSGGTQYLNAAVLAAGLNDVTLATRSPGTGNLWCASNSTAQLDHVVILDLVD